MTDPTTTIEPTETSAETPSIEGVKPEQRRHHRLCTNLNVRVSWIDGFGLANETAAVVKNISAGGFGIELDQKRPLGSRLAVNTETNSMQCVVRHVQPKQDVLYVGVEILPAPEDARRTDSLDRLGDALLGVA